MRALRGRRPTLTGSGGRDPSSQDTRRGATATPHQPTSRGRLAALRPVEVRRRRGSRVAAVATASCVSRRRSDAVAALWSRDAGDSACSARQSSVDCGRRPGPPTQAGESRIFRWVSGADKAAPRALWRLGSRAAVPPLMAGVAPWPRIRPESPVCAAVFRARGEGAEAASAPSGWAALQHWTRIERAPICDSVCGRGSPPVDGWRRSLA